MRDRERLYWVMLGGIFFWVPFILALVLDPRIHNLVVTFIFCPLAGIAFVCAAGWILSGHEPRWGWTLAGIYILGAITLLAFSVIFRAHFQSVLDMAQRIVFRLFAVSFSLVIVTLVLLAMCLRPKRMIG